MASDWFDEGGSGSPVDVGRILDTGAPDVMWEIVSAGALVSVGTTSDGGSLAVTVTLDGRWRRVYVRDGEELLGWLNAALGAVRSGPARSPAPPAPRGRGRRA